MMVVVGAVLATTGVGFRFGFNFSVADVSKT